MGPHTIIGHKAPSTKRCIKTRIRTPARRSRSQRVIKHRAPNGALRPSDGQHVEGAGLQVIKHRAPNGALRRISSSASKMSSSGHKAPSAKRCIKTFEDVAVCRGGSFVIKHRAPNGALRPNFNNAIHVRTPLCHKAPSAKRCIKTRPPQSVHCARRNRVIKHRAPNGALRRSCQDRQREDLQPRHKAPSAKRCIKTSTTWPPLPSPPRHKAPSAKRCIKTLIVRNLLHTSSLS